MKICTITCQNANNHGARLQCYALVRYLQKQGHEVEVIDYRPNGDGRAKLWYWPGSSLKEWVKLFVRLPQRIRANKRQTYFEAFSQKYIPRTRIYYNIDALRKDPPQADLYIAGSDQIWNTTLRNGTDPAYYLDFGPKETRRVAFAASFAIPEIAEEHKNWVQKNLLRFDKITVREQSALRILQNLGLVGTQQEDPVFLLSQDEWNQVADCTGTGEKYVLVYDFYLGDDIKAIAQKEARVRNCKIYAICHESLSYADKNFVYAGPETFVSLIKHAQCVISNSFHGTVFAIIYHVPFRVLDRPDGLNVRMHDLLERKGYLSRAYSCHAWMTVADGMDVGD